MTDSTPAAPEDKAPRGHTRRAIAIAAVLSVGAFVVFNSCTPSDDERASDSCHDAVADKLTSPSTAEFNDDSIERDGDYWEFRGSVDSQNDYGAMTRGRWLCIVRKGSDGTFLIQFTTVG